MYNAAVIVVSDTVSQGLKVDTSGKKICEILKENNYNIAYEGITNDDKENIKKELKKCVEEIKADLIVTTGGTGFAIRDNTPEATKEFVDKEVPGIPEYMRSENIKITNRACLSRAACGIKNRSLIINLPGSERAVKENLCSILPVLEHGLQMLKGEGSAMCGEKKAKIKAVCISEKKGVQKHTVDKIELKKDWGIVGDAHAANWHRQVSLLSAVSVKKVQDKIDFELKAGAFAENILIEDGICLYELAVGTKLKIGTAITEVTQIGKECHYDCEIRKKAGDCVMPREGIFVKVLEDGVAKAGDEVVVIR